MNILIKGMIVFQGDLTSIMARGPENVMGVLMKVLIRGVIVFKGSVS